MTRFALPLRFLGFGFYWAWMTTFWTGSVRSPLGMPQVEQTTVARISVQVVTALTFIVAALLARKLTSSLGERLLVLGGAILGPLGTVMATLGHDQPAGSFPAYLVVAWVFLGIACACVTLLWGRFYSSIGLRRASMYMPLSMVLSVLIGFILSSMQPVVAIVITTLLPLLSIVMFLLIAPELPPLEQQATRGRCRPRGVLWRISLAIAVYSLVLGFYLNSRALFGNNSPSSVTGRLVFLTMPLIAILLLRKNNFGLIFRIALPLTAAGFLLLPFLSENVSWIGTDIVAAGGTLFDIISWIALADIAYRGLSPMTAYGFGRAANAGGIAIGWAASYLLLKGSSAVPSTTLGFSLVMVFILILTSTLILRERDFPIEGAALIAPPTDEPDQLAPDGRLSAGRWRRACARIAHEHGLSPREEEVMVLLAKGRSMKHIEETLVISFHTAKAHTNHIYRKLDVHSRQELIDLVESEKEYEPHTEADPSAGAVPATNESGEAPGPPSENAVAGHPYRTDAP